MTEQLYAAALLKIEELEKQNDELKWKIMQANKALILCGDKLYTSTNRREYNIINKAIKNTTL